MTARVSQQIINVVYTTDPAIRVSAVAVEVIRSTATTAPTATNKPKIVIIASAEG